MIINVRGTSGSGKSTLVRKIMGLYPSQVAWREINLTLFGYEERRRPFGYVLDRTEDGGRSLFVPGHYETACGGCDTLATRQFDVVDMLVRHWAAKDLDVLFEGLLLSAESARMIKLHQDGMPLVVVGLTTPLEECLAGIRSRREEKGGARAGQPFADSVLKNATAKQKGSESCLRKMEHAGVEVHRLDREAAFQLVRLRLGL